jgi:mannosyl-oligosaccharide alpha-1,3-glucosidase
MRGPFSGDCWPGKSLWIDFFSREGSDYWANLFNYESFRGTSQNYGAWIDMNEPSVFDGPEGILPKKVLHSINGTDRHHRDVHNAYGHLMAQATY